MIFKTFLVAICCATSSFAGVDRAGSQDHRLISRYPGSFINSYRKTDFDQHTVVTGKFDKSARTLPQQKVEGRITQITYAIPKGRSVFEVYKNYESALNKAGFEILYQGTAEAELGKRFGEAVYPANICGRTAIKKNNPERYLLAKLQRPEGNVWVTLFVNQTSYSGTCGSDTVAILDVVEEKPMQQGLVSADAKAMAEALDKTGHVAIYGIFFDTDSARLKAESNPTLAEIAKLLQQRQKLKLMIVGHTDATGGHDHNMELSRNRAAAVVHALITRQGVGKDRLRPYGVGPLAPKETNRTEEGRAKNRRVELIELL